MAERAVLDSSAILAFLFEEPGRDFVRPYLGEGVCSAVNLAEVATKLIERGMVHEAAAAVINDLPLEVHPLDGEDAMPIGRLRALTSDSGLSLGDRACLSLAQRLALPAITADRAWHSVSAAVGIEIRLIR